MALSADTRAYRAVIALARRADLSDREKLRRVGDAWKPLMRDALALIKEEKIPLAGKPALLARSKVPLSKLNRIERDFSNTTGALHQLYVDHSLGVGVKLWHCAKGGICWSLRDHGIDVFYKDRITKQPMRFVNKEAALACVARIIDQTQEK